jgi:hypothetical protein
MRPCSAVTAVYHVTKHADSAQKIYESNIKLLRKANIRSEHKLQCFAGRLDYLFFESFYLF